MHLIASLANKEGAQVVSWRKASEQKSLLTAITSDQAKTIYQVAIRCFFRSLQWLDPYSSISCGSSQLHTSYHACLSGNIGYDFCSRALPSRNGASGASQNSRPLTGDCIYITSSSH
jgi:hypothetical protein